MDEMRRFTKSCHQAGVVIHGTFILGLPVETPQSIANTINFAKELDVFSLQVSLAAPYPGTELYEIAKQNGWFVKKDKTDLRNADETEVRMLKPGHGKTIKGYLSGYAGDANHRFVFYDFRPSRSRDGPAEMLATYRGYLQTDGYSVYTSLVCHSAGDWWTWRVGLTVGGASRKRFRRPATRLSTRP